MAEILSPWETGLGLVVDFLANGSSPLYQQSCTLPSLQFLLLPFNEKSTFFLRAKALGPELP